MPLIIVSHGKQWKRPGWTVGKKTWVGIPGLPLFKSEQSKSPSWTSPPSSENKDNNTELSTWHTVRGSNETLLTKATCKTISCSLHINLTFNCSQCPHYPIYSFKWLVSKCYSVFLWRIGIILFISLCAKNTGRKTLWWIKIGLILISMCLTFKELNSEQHCRKHKSFYAWGMKAAGRKGSWTRTKEESTLLNAASSPQGDPNGHSLKSKKNIQNAHFKTPQRHIYARDEMLK